MRTFTGKLTSSRGTSRPSSEWPAREAVARRVALSRRVLFPICSKMESFIRSKYETKRWAMEGPVPEPESLDGADVRAPGVPPPKVATGTDFAFSRAERTDAYCFCPCPCPILVARSRREIGRAHV